MTGPLSGVKVIDLSAVVSGPMAAGMLAEQGADVIKIEPPGGDMSRRVGPAKGDISAMFMAINRGKRSIALDLKLAQARELLHEFIRGADILIENFRPGTMARLGLSYEEVRKSNPGLIYLSISGFGQSGPYSHARVYDYVIQAASGFADAHGNAETGTPGLLPTLMCDKLTALHAAQALCAALHARHVSGEGQKIELAMLDASIAFLWPEAMYNQSFLEDPPPRAPEFGANQKPWQCRNGWFTSMTPQPDEFAAFCRGFGRPELTQDPRFATMEARRRNYQALREILDPIALEQDVDVFVERLVKEGAPVGRVNVKSGLGNDPQVRHNGTISRYAMGDVGLVQLPRAAAVFGGTPGPDGLHAPHVGQHGRELLEELGKEPGEIEALIGAGVVCGVVPLD
ncbi:CaiB/BaiF CoA transferase family protein [Noviherbaspirillum galbum]|uniref:CoA transferase n=1 Tax=Noviherbaspirillum galbum TaxID=2709383 RepID=A0A6B3SYV1_9BURK|nr:CoA transferase [Noviherbaspirillum galbum]NEX64836.1 CoA transferase [Noviherbaspirillum galbum]